MPPKCCSFHFPKLPFRRNPGRGDPMRWNSPHQYLPTSQVDGDPFCHSDSDLDADDIDDDDSSGDALERLHKAPSGPLVITSLEDCLRSNTGTKRKRPGRKEDFELIGHVKDVIVLEDDEPSLNRLFDERSDEDWETVHDAEYRFSNRRTYSEALRGNGSGAKT